MNEPQQPEFNDILEDCLQAVLRDGQSLDDCLAQYPQHAAQLRPALQVALLAARLKSPEMPAAHVDALEARLRGHMQLSRAQQPASPRPQVIQRRLGLLAKLAAMIAVALLLAFGAGGGAVAASANSIPGDPLYGVKRLWEAIILALSPLSGDLDDIWLWLAQARLYEADQLAAQGRLTDEALVELYEAMAMSIALADAESAPQVVAYLDDARVILAQMTAAPEIEATYARVLALAQPVLEADGRLQPPAQLSIRPADAPAATLTPTHTPVITDTLPPTFTPTSTETLAAVSPQPTETRTPTPRVPATSTYTPTATVTPTATITPTITPTATWTPLPLPTRPGSAGPDDGQPTRDPGIRPTDPPLLPTSDATVRYRETERAAYETQTAQPPATETPAAP